MTHELPKTSEPATRAFLLAGYTRLEDFTGVSAEELLALHGVGPKAVRLLREALAERGMSLAGE
ncbi:DNA-binding protein [Allokutzneria oryzae]|uniref:DNA-binding protein n=1 Tax=Allokutzneria oryzae TaxID=1378989 RepID=A0ABV6A1P3_9PSEU